MLWPEHGYCIYAWQIRKMDLLHHTIKKKQLLSCFDWRLITLNIHKGYINSFVDNMIAKSFIKANIRVAVKQIEDGQIINFERFLRQWTVDVGVLMDAQCYDSKGVLDKARFII